jgi:hypothetical protein
MFCNGKKVFITSADTRVGRVLGRALRDVGCAVYGLRTCREELEFAVETFLADYVVRPLLFVPPLSFRLTASLPDAKLVIPFSRLNKDPDGNECTGAYRTDGFNPVHFATSSPPSPLVTHPTDVNET